MPFQLAHPGHPPSDVPVLDVLAVLLGNGRSSRLFQEVREKQGVVHHVDSWTYNPGRPGLFGMSAVVDGDKFEAARDAMLAEVERMKRKPIAPPNWRGREAIRLRHAGGAEDDARPGARPRRKLAVSKRPEFSARYLAAVQRIAPADLQRVACEYLTPRTARFTRCCPTARRPRNLHTSKAPRTTPSRSLICRTACACW